jgi:hypothetical protein
MTALTREEFRMPRPLFTRLAVIGVLALAAPGAVASSAQAGGFTVASCQADRLNFSTTAFNDFATRGMRIRRACNPAGPGIRGLVTANARRDAVPRGSVAMVTLSAPAGTSFSSFAWAGSIRRTDCRYSLQIYAEVPNANAVPIRKTR